jgi:peptidoglycan/LPS O-acetylase OafA/YrhL
MTQTWSLAIEVQFYLLFPLIFFGRRKFTKLFVSLSLVYFFLGVFGLLDKEIIYTNLIGTFWIFYLGKFCAENLKGFTVTKITVFYLLIPLLALVLFQFEELTGQLALGASIAMLYIVINLENRTVNFLNSIALKNLIHLLGKLTYPFFLIHSLAIGFVKSFNFFSYVSLQWLIQLFFSLLIAFIMHYYFERRFIDYRRKSLM